MTDCQFIINLLIRVLLWLATVASKLRRPPENELEALRQRVVELESEVAILRKRVSKEKRHRHTWREKLLIMLHIEQFGIARHKVTEIFGIARSTIPFEQI